MDNGKPSLSRVTIAGLAALALAGLSHAAAPTPVAEKPPATVLLPPVDPAGALVGRPLLDALRRGGFVLYVRHTEQADVAQNDCNVPVLTPAGIASAERLGEALRHAAIPVGAPLASPLCRALHTARLLKIGDPVTDASLVPGTEREQVEGRDRLLATRPPAGRNTVLVGHVVAGAEGKALSTEKGGIIVFRPDGSGGRAVVAHVLPDQWAAWSREDEPAR